MYRILGLSLLMAALAALLVGCGGGGGGGGVIATTNLVPLEVGNEWRYDYVEYTEPAALRHASLRPRTSFVHTSDLSAEDVVTVTTTQMIGNAEWFAVVARYVGGEPGDPVYLRHIPQGMQRRDGLNQAAYYMIRTPLAVGTNWSVTYMDQGETFVEVFTIVNLDAEVAVPGGIFRNCVQIENVLSVPGQPDDVITYWYAPGVGQVREERHVGATLIYDLNLKEYTLADG